VSLLFSHAKVEAFVRAEPSGTQKGVREPTRTVNAMGRRIDDIELGARGTDPSESEEMCRASGAAEGRFHQGRKRKRSWPAPFDPASSSAMQTAQITVRRERRWQAKMMGSLAGAVPYNHQAATGVRRGCESGRRNPHLGRTR